MVSLLLLIGSWNTTRRWLVNKYPFCPIKKEFCLTDAQPVVYTYIYKYIKIGWEHIRSIVFKWPRQDDIYICIVIHNFVHTIFICFIILSDIYTYKKYFYIFMINMFHHLEWYIYKKCFYMFMINMFHHLEWYTHTFIYNDLMILHIYDKYTCYLDATFDRFQFPARCAVDLECRRKCQAWPTCRLVWVFMNFLCIEDAT